LLKHRLGRRYLHLPWSQIALAPHEWVDPNRA
jgi:hypothetical protein